jgi:hypothetical protein
MHQNYDLWKFYVYAPGFENFHVNTQDHEEISKFKSKLHSVQEFINKENVKYLSTATKVFIVMFYVKVQLFLCLTKYHTMKMYGGGKIEIHKFITVALDGGEESASCPSCFTPSTQWIGNSGWPGKERNPYPSPVICLIYNSTLKERGEYCIMKQALSFKAEGLLACLQ